jgi:hypothetical protein
VDSVQADKRILISGKIANRETSPLISCCANDSMAADVKRDFKSVVWRVSINLFIAIADKRSARFPENIADNRLQLTQYDAKILGREQHALPIDHILDALLVPAGTRVAAPNLNHGPARGSAHRSSERIQIRNAKEVFWDIASVDQHAHP